MASVGIQRQVQWIVALAWVLLAACGSPVDERWDGQLSQCWGGEFQDDSEHDIRLELDGPITAQPDGRLHQYLGDGSFVDSEIQDARYVGMRLTFRTETSASALGARVVTVTKYDLVRAPDALRGRAVATTGDATRTCAVELERR